MAGRIWTARNALIQWCSRQSESELQHDLGGARRAKSFRGLRLWRSRFLAACFEQLPTCRVTSAPPLTAANRVQAFDTAESNPTPDHVTALAAMAQATTFRSPRMLWQQQAQMTSDIKTSSRTIPPLWLPANYMTGRSRTGNGGTDCGRTPSGTQCGAGRTDYTAWPSTAAPNAGTPTAPATGSSTGNWFTDEMISGVPNWALAAGGAVVLLLLMKK